MNFYNNLIRDLFSDAAREPATIEYRGKRDYLGMVRSVFGEGYSSLKGWLGRNGIKKRVSPDRIEVGDFFNPTAGYVINTPEGNYHLPRGQINAMRYRDLFGDDVVAMDESLIKGTPKNLRLKEFYQSARRDIGKLYSRYANLRPLLSGLDNVYKGILRTIEDGRGAVYTMTHELAHNLTWHINSREANEAATDLITESARSRDESVGAYYVFKNRLKNVLHSTRTRISDIVRNSWLSRMIEGLYYNPRPGFGGA